jgi:hypothetical protein
MIQVTYALAMAAGRDAGNRNMREAGRATWSRSDFKAAADTVAHLLGEQDVIHHIDARQAREVQSWQ